ncbi:hypothetical protein OF829_12710 [Sphingomonas sp. LB-2]|uniref:hypothetical protein n=1 Tax=Sphingomonas caeni TaxID=2984949 RepID=UPI002231E7A3|nr:hypothetical protein [Sphingomonas caeni]MCW3848104.1 hypothetical protein [Sphingomonas caeni]
MARPIGSIPDCRRRFGSRQGRRTDSRRTEVDSGRQLATLVAGGAMSNNGEAQGQFRQLGERRVPARCYVYAHRSADGTPFYIGKGTGRRAWSLDRDDLWRHFVRTRCGDSYEIAILAEDLDEEEALEIEGELIARHGEQLVNWINPGRQFDYAALDRFHATRDATRSFVSETRPLEQSDPEGAVTRYREAIERVHEYTGMEYESGLVADLQREVGRPQFGEIAPLDRLTLVLRKLGRFPELVDAVDAWFARYPDSVTLNHAVLKRRAEAAAIVAGERPVPRRPVAPPRARKKGTVPEAELAGLLEKARRDRAPWDWILAARLCRQHHDLVREVALLEEFLAGPRVPGRSWLELEERLYKVRAMLCEAREVP